MSVDGALPQMQQNRGLDACRRPGTHLDIFSRGPLYGTKLVQCRRKVPGLMKIYRKVIPKISKDVVRSLLANRAIEVEDGRRDEAELDIAGVLVEYLNDLDRISPDAHD